ncbi:OmpH family outer membrane protein [Changchengzhania lutea]|uniref:OmpH family outer membrane protein n=1 Tax=Changchengzhania lutea TaxID=2049305 RepID=UPI00115C68BF|nr:OmpH family outer membrane protein [Changchengzhania lutea]
MNTSKTIIAILVLAILIPLSIFFKPNKLKVAYVFVENVMQEYHALQDIDDKLILKEAVKKKKLDAFYENIQEKIKWLNENNKKIEEDERIDKQHEIIDLERIHRQMQSQTIHELDSLKTLWMKPVYDEVNEYIKTYSKDNGFDYVLGNLGNGNIMFGNHIYDITLEVIDGLNVAYNKKIIE